MSGSSLMLLLLATQFGLDSKDTISPVACTIREDSILHDRFPPLKLLDGQSANPASRWASSRSPGAHWVVIELKRPAVIDRLVVHGHDDAKGLALADAEVQLREGDAWRTLAVLWSDR